MRLITLCLLLLMVNPMTYAQKRKKDKEPEEPPKEKFSSPTFNGLKFREIGPAFTSGRVVDFAVNPNNHSEYYVASASGGVWKTMNNGTTYEPLFDKEGSYSIGCVTLAPTNSSVVWVGTGENNNQRSVAYGDGVYKSLDAGKSWKNMGLKNSEHIAKIIVHPQDENTVFVAAYGPLWSAGGDRGIYKTTDGGTTWQKLLDVSENTGFSDLVMDPRDPNTLYAAAHQRRRHVFTYISGGPESAIYKTTDGGKTWNKLEQGIPKVDLGRIALAVSPVNPDHVFAMIEAEDDKGGLYASTDRGASWSKRSDYYTSGNYYQELFCHPTKADVIYAVDTWGQVSTDGGKTWKRIGNKSRHVDDHAYWIDPAIDGHLLVGCDGGIYESFDNGDNWQFKANLPVTQFYRVAVDYDEPFYNVYGGTQDNFTLSGPSRTTNQAGIANRDWFVVANGDGFEPQVDPTDADIVYAQSQYGGLNRYDRKSGESISIKPLEGAGDPGLRWNWDAPLIISPHDPRTLYFAANKLFKSTDQGNSWQLISPDLTRQLDRNALPVMGRVWSVDAVAKNKSTSIYGNIVALNESPKKKGLLYAGTDDGLVQVSENDGGDWRKEGSFAGVPEMTYVNCLLASQFDENVVYAAFNNHKNGDFKPYLLKSTDKGKTWKSISSNLPERGSVYSIAEDDMNKDLLFAGTEFGVFFTIDGGQKWIQLKGGLPTIAVRDIEIQRRENDLVLATFGRGFWILDDYSILRDLKKEDLETPAKLFTGRDAKLFVEAAPLGYSGKGFQGESFFTAENPAVGVVISYYLKEPIKTLKEQRQETEAKMVKDGRVLKYPTIDTLRMEDTEEKPYLIFTITDEDGNVVRRLTAKPATGINRVVWDFRYPLATPVSLKKPEKNPWGPDPGGYLAVPGTYYVQMAKSENGIVSNLTGKMPFKINPLKLNAFRYQDAAAVNAFAKKVRNLQQAATGAGKALEEMGERVQYLEEAVKLTPDVPVERLNEMRMLKDSVNELKRILYGDNTLGSREFEQPPSLSGRLNQVVGNLFYTTTAPTKTYEEQYDIAADLLTPFLQRLRIIDTKLRNIEQELDAKGAPWTPGRIPEWQK